MRIFTVPAGHAETAARMLKAVRDTAVSDPIPDGDWRHDGSPSTVWFCVEASDRLPEVVREITKALVAASPVRAGALTPSVEEAAGVRQPSSSPSGAQAA